MNSFLSRIFVVTLAISSIHTPAQSTQLLRIPKSIAIGATIGAVTGTVASLFTGFTCGIFNEYLIPLSQEILAKESDLMKNNVKTGLNIVLIASILTINCSEFYNRLQIIKEEAKHDTNKKSYNKALLGTSAELASWIAFYAASTYLLPTLFNQWYKEKTVSDSIIATCKCTWQSLRALLPA